MTCPYTNCLTLNIFATSHFQAFSVLDVNEFSSLVSENLEPSRVGAPDLHVVGSSSTLDIPRLVVVSGSNGQRLLMEVPNLGVSSVWSLDNHVSVVDKIEVSILFQLRNNMEVFFYNESEFLVHFSFSGLTFPFIDVDDVPLLMNAIVSTIDTNVSVFLVNVSYNLHYFASLIDDVVILESEKLPPSGVGCCTSQIVAISI
jgi:hypothetical protein